jgi:transcriptional antiterminator RfaH
MPDVDEACESSWLVAHTKPRCEKKFAELLKREAVEHELPLVTSVRRYQTQTKRFTKPLFPGYVFALIPPEKTSRLYQGDFVATLIRVRDQETFVRQLEAIRRIMATGMDIVPAPQLDKGTRVKIVGGPLHGVEGVVEDPAAPKGVVVAIDVIQQGVLIHVASSDLEVMV